MQDYTAKLSDFGLAKAGPQGDETHVSTRVMGTYGYAAPEYVMTGKASNIVGGLSYQLLRIHLFLLAAGKALLLANWVLDRSYI